MARKKKTTITPEEQIQNTIASMVVDSEYRNSAANQKDENIDFESLVDMLEGLRTQKDYEWMSDYTLPELISIILTDSSQWANQYFQSRDFVEVKLDGEGPEDFNKAQAAKTCINKTLNDRDIYYFQKYMRIRTINALIGKCYALCWWEQELRKEKKTVLKKQIVYDERNVPVGVTDVPTIIEVERPVVDRFNFEVLDPRNVFTDNKYCYTAQQKDWFIIRDETTYDRLKADEKKSNYINLDKVKEAVKDRKASSTETSKETYGKDSDGDIGKTPVVYFDIIDRYGKFWGIVTKRDKGGNPLEALPGIDIDGVPIDNAELIEMILTFVIIGNSKILIRFTPTDKIDSTGKPFKPIVRGWCYIHPTKDKGLSDGKNMGALQVAIDDTFNMSSDRVKLATLPVFKGKKYSLEDNSTVYMEPEHVIELEDPEDLQELKINSDVSGALNQLGMLTGKMQQVTATYPHSMGALPDMASTTATAVAGAETRTNARANYKSLTFEYTFLTEFYWMILQMTSRFSHDETLINMLGESAQYFDANANYTYTPVTSNIEAEYSKYRKIQLYDQTIGRLQGMVQVLPKTVPILAHMLGRQLVLQGDEYQDIGVMVADLAKSQPVQEEEQPGQVSDMSAPATSNQNGLPMSTMETETRNGLMQGAIQ